MAKSRMDDEDDDVPVKRSVRRRDDDENEEPRPRRKKSKDSALSGVIPYKNGFALIAYYSGFAALIVILGSVALLKADPTWLNRTLVRALMIGIGGFLAIAAAVLGGVGLFYVGKNPKARGTAHAFIGIMLGLIELVGLAGLLMSPNLLEGR